MTQSSKSLRRSGVVDLAIIVITAIASTATAFRLINSDFVSIFALIFLIFVVAAWLSSTPWISDAFVALAALMFGLAIAEGVLSMIEPEASKTIHSAARYTKGYSQPLRNNGGALGYGAYPARSVRSWKTRGNEAVYDVVYTIDGDGFRKTPGFTESSGAGKPVVFFGGSFAFGEGLNDDETLAYFVAAQTHWKIPILNLGFSGYGPHQMLRSMELGTLRELNHDTVLAVVYEAVPDHARRAAGRAWWDPVGPRYEINDGGDLEYTGKFTDISEQYLEPYYRFLQFIRVARRSRVFDWTTNLFSGTEASDPEQDAQLMASIVAETAAIIEHEYHGRFVVLLWDDDSPESSLIVEKLAAMKIRTIRVSDIIPRSQIAGYKIPDDGHPTAAANALLAETLIRNLRLAH